MHSDTGQQTETAARRTETSDVATYPVGPQSAGTLSLAQFQRLLYEAVSGGVDKWRALSNVLEVVDRHTAAAAFVYFARDASNRLSPLNPEALEDIQALATIADKQWVAWCSQACSKGQIQHNVVDGPVQSILLSVPVARRGKSDEALCALFTATRLPTAQCLDLLQLAATHLTLWDLWNDSEEAESETRVIAAVMELVAKVEVAHTLQEAATTVVNELRGFLACEQAVLGMTTKGRQSCRLVAVSAVSQFDKRSRLTRAMEATLDEALIKNELTIRTATGESAASASLAHRKLLDETSMGCVASIPLSNHRGDAIGSVLVLGGDELRHRAELPRVLRAAEVPVGSSLGLLRDARRGLLKRCVDSSLQTVKSRWLLFSMLAITTLLAILYQTMPYKLACDCALEPVTKRFVVAPFEGSLEKTLVEPGDVVQSNQVLARMDGRELRWELAGLEADYNRAEKQKDAALAARKTSAAQIANLEMEQLGLKIKLLQHRNTQLEIRSPFDGMVVSGDLERVEGAPLSVGQTLFEVAPLEEMIVEIAIPESEIAYFHDGLPVTIRLDSYPNHTWKGVIRKIHPRSEIREQESVFLAEVALENAEGELRPGMKGQARITGDQRSIAWILFHRPFEALQRKLGW